MQGRNNEEKGKNYIFPSLALIFLSGNGTAIFIKYAQLFMIEIGQTSVR